MSYRHVETYQEVGHYFRFFFQGSFLPSHFVQVSDLVPKVEDILKNESQWSGGGFFEQTKSSCEGPQIGVSAGGDRAGRLRCKIVRFVHSCVTGARVCGNLGHVPCILRAVRVCKIVDTCQCALSRHLYVFYRSWVQNVRSMPLCAGCFCTVSVSKCPHRSYMNDFRACVACTCEIDERVLICMRYARMYGRVSVDGFMI